MALSPHSEKVLYLNFGPFCVEFIYSHCVCMGTPQGFLPQCKDLHGFRLNGDFDLTLCVNYCLFLCGGPARERRPVQGIPCLLLCGFFKHHDLKKNVNQTFTIQSKCIQSSVSNTAKMQRFTAAVKWYKSWIVWDSEKRQWSKSKMSFIRCSQVLALTLSTNSLTNWFWFLALFFGCFSFFLKHYIKFLNI